MKLFAQMTTSKEALYHPPPRSDVLNWPGIGRFLRWRHGRLVGQVFLLLVASLIIYDGLTGPQLAQENLATNIVWLQYRGFVMLALLFAGNLFCMNCPFTIPRSLARRWSIGGRRWPRALRNKWLALAVLFFYFFLYEWLDIWASPWLTVWIVIAYFLSALVLEMFFSESPFCKYVCPLGTFNFVGSTISPLQITVLNQDVCRECEGHECVNGARAAGGSWQMLGCGTELYPPQVRSNMDCVLCLDCARACPYDNIALPVRPLLGELRRPDAWPHRWDLSFLVWFFTFSALSNAFGMTPPVYSTATWLAGLLNTSNEALLLLIIFGVLNILLPLILGLFVAWLSRAVAGSAEPLRVSFSKFTPILVPLAFATWFAHYSFHFLTGALAIIPAMQGFLIDHGILILGETPNWQLSAILPFPWLLPLEVLCIVAGFAGSYWVLGDIANREKTSFMAQLPWLLLLLGVSITAIYLFTLPMEMRGTSLMN
jgi:polyferredoxin